jgi:V/A-type H+-transporting ATPase subunit I
MALALRYLWAPKYPVLKDASYIFGAAALSATLFGVLFGEYFGHLGVFVATKMGLTNIFHGLNPADPWHGHIHLWIGRTDEYLPRYLAYSCILGVAHMSFSLLLGIYTALGHYKEASEHDDKQHMEHSLSHALEKIAMLMSLIGFILVAIGGIVPDLAYVGQNVTSTEGLLSKAGLALVAVAISILIYALPGLQKLTAPIEGVAILSNTISYSRLMAVGVAGVVLANIANDLGRFGFEPGTNIALTALCVLGAVFLHIGALLIAIFDPMIQALRLHYVEFFGKFFESEGMDYTPLARKGGSFR